VITITGIGDHLRPEWPITITGTRTINEFAGGRRLKLNAFAAVLVAVRMILVRSHLLGELHHGRGRVRGCAENYRGASGARPTLQQCAARNWC
jgi:hypothetical protein